MLPESCPGNTSFTHSYGIQHPFRIADLVSPDDGLGVRASRLVGTCAMIVADYKMQGWRQSDRSLSGDAAASKRRVEDAEQALLLYSLESRVE